MRDASLPLQIAVMKIVNASEELRLLVADSIFDAVPQGQRAPYVTFLEWQDLESGTDIGDTHEVNFQAQCFSDVPGRDEVAKMAGVLQTLLHGASPQIFGFGECAIEWRNTSYLREPDGVTYRAVVSFRALIDEAY